MGYSVAAAVVVVAGVGTGAAAYAAGVVGRGAEPEAIAPASSIAFMRLDLNPSLGQKLDLARFSAAFPGNGSHLKTYAGLRDDFIESMAGGADDPVPLSSWFAGRAAVAAYPDAAAAGGVTPIGIVQYTDETAMLKEMAHESTVEDDFGFAVDTADHYVVVSSSVAAATRALAAARAQPLSTNPTFRPTSRACPRTTTRASCGAT